MERTKGELEITEGVKIYIVPVEADEIICEIPYDYAKDFNKTEQELLANAKRLVKCWNSHDDLLAACKLAETVIAWFGKIKNIPDQLKADMEQIEQAIAKAEKS